MARQGFTYLKRGQCPICQTRSDCRTSHHGDMVHCRAGNEPPDGWKLIGSDGSGFEMFVLGNESLTEQEREQRAQRFRQERQIRQHRQEEELRTSLPIPLRDRAIRRFHRYMGLGALERDHLLARGLTVEQIELGCFFTVHPGTEVPPFTPQNLPGVDYRNRLVAQSRAIACPTFWFGEVSGYQLRLMDERTGKYRWASGVKSSHLPNGELPVTVVGELGESGGVLNFCEGVLKPYVAQCIRGGVWFGASGGNLISSSTQFGEVVERLGVSTLIIHPDVGDTSNRHVMKRWRKTIDYLKQNYIDLLVLVAWWNQGEGDDRVGFDCDDIAFAGNGDAPALFYLSVAQFYEIAVADGGLFEDLDAVVVEPDRDLYLEYLEWEEEQERLEQLQVNLKFKQFKEVAEARQFEKWKQSRQLIPEITEETRFVSTQDAGEGSILCIKGRTGCGKTERLMQMSYDFIRDNPFCKFLSLGSRNTLLIQLCHRIPFFYHWHRDDGGLFVQADGAGIAMCVDSLQKLSCENLEDRVLVLDEVVGTVQHLLHSPTIRSGDRATIIWLFKEAIRRARQVICLDGNLDSLTVEFLKRIDPSKRVVVVENVYPQPRPPVYWIEGSSEDGETLNSNDFSELLRLMEEGIALITSDSQIALEALDEKLALMGKQGIRVDRKTIADETVKDEVFGDTDAYIATHQPDYFLLSPTGESGLDISIENYFTHHIHLGFGVVSVNTCLQQIGRLRDPNVPRYVWIAKLGLNTEDGGIKSTSAEEIERTRIEFFNWDVINSVKDVSAWTDEISQRLQLIRNNSVDSPEYAISCAMQAINNYEKANYRECVKYALQEAGYDMQEMVIAPDLGAKEEYKQLKKSVKEQNSLDIYRAEMVSVADIEKLNFDSSYKHQCEQLNARMRQRLPGIESTSSWSSNFFYRCMYGDRSFISASQTYWLLHNLDAAKNMASDRIRKIHRSGRIFLATYRSLFSKVSALAELGLLDFLTDEGAEWEPDSDAVIKLYQKGQDRHIINAIGKRPGKQSPIRYLGELLKLVGLKLKSRKVGKGRHRIYFIDSASWNDVDRQNILDCIDRKWGDFKVQMAGDWTVSDEAVETPETLTQSKFVGGGQELPNLYNNNPSPAHPIESESDLIEVGIQVWVDGCWQTGHCILVEEDEYLFRLLDGRQVRSRSDQFRIVDPLSSVGDLHKW